jgi:AcrR family transcriptional regulator
VPAPPDRPTLRARYDAKQQAVVETAARLFAQRGYHATSVSDLVEATGLASGGLYHYIGSKEQLLFRVFDQLMDPLLEQAEEIAGTAAEPEEQLRALLRTWMSHVEAHLHHMRVLQQEWHFVSRRPEWERVLAARRRFEAILAEVLDRVREAGLLDRSADPGLVQLAVLGMVNYTPQWFDPRGRLGAEQIADGYCDLLLGT